MDGESQGYFEHRERSERSAAKKAACPRARRVHQELAQRYADLARDDGAPMPAEQPAPRSRLSIIAG